MMVDREHWDEVDSNEILSWPVCDSGDDSRSRWTSSHFDLPATELAKKLLGTYLVRRVNETLLRGIIVETEAYCGTEDPASHSYQGKCTSRNQAMFRPPGTAYVYSIHGIYFCFNITSKGEGAAVLIRAVSPIEGQETMSVHRANTRQRINTPLKKPCTYADHLLCNGPSKTCISYGINKKLDGVDLSKSPELWIEVNPTPPQDKIVTSSRIGIQSCGEEASNMPLRFYLQNNKSVSKIDKEAEKLLLE